jgi:photosystem II stability/assembly factor-like uncharacterized protein
MSYVFHFLYYNKLNPETPLSKKLTFIVLLLSSIISFLMINPSNGTPPIKPTQGDKDDPFAASDFRYKMVAGKSGHIDPQARLRAVDFTMRYLQPDKKLMKSNGIAGWTPIGPGNIGGRIRAIVILPSNTSEILIGSASGGIWKTTNAGTSWTPKLDSGTQLAIGCMVKDPNNENIVYAGTGEGWGNIDAVYGGGIYKSTDFGESWSLLASTTGTWNFKNVVSMTIDPASGNLYAVTFAYNYKDGGGSYSYNGGLYCSTNGGISWTKISTSAVANYYEGSDVVAFSSNVIIFATRGNDGIYRTTNGGTTWTKLISNLPTSNLDRISFARDPNNLNTVYAQIASSTTGAPDYGLIGIYKSIDAGATLSILTKPPNIASTGNLSFLSSQGWYDNVIAVDPFNSNNIHVGGVDMMKSTNGGTSWFQLAYWTSYYGTPVVHADHHAIAFDPVTPNIVYDGNDGGIYKSTNGGSTWNMINNNLAITQFYGGSVFPTGNTFLGGTQDNGHLKFSSGTNWNTVCGGDGGYAAQDQSNSSVSYEEYVYLQMSKTINGGTNWSSCTSGLADVNTNLCLFISPFVLNPMNSVVLAAGSDKVWVTTNSAASWTKVSNTLSASGLITALTITNSSSPYLTFAGTEDGKVFKCTSLNPALGINTWTDITPAGNNAAYVRRIIIDPINQQNIYCCYSGYNNANNGKHIWYSTNQGTSWTDISTGLPDVPVHSLLIDKFISSTLYIGTETGVYQSINNGNSWVAATMGMPAYVPVDELVYQTGTNYIFAFTHGRSVFKTDNPVPIELSTFESSTFGRDIQLKWTTKTEINSNKFEVERMSTFSWFTVGSLNAAGQSSSPNSYSFIDKNLQSGKYQYRLKMIDNDGAFKYSSIANALISVPDEFSLTQNYPNPFNPSTIINYSIPENMRVTLSIYNIKGELIRTIVDGFQKAGYFSVSFNGQGLSNGIYFYKLDTGKYSQTKKMIFIK